ncbi:plastocyanin [Herbaspirillum sp. HC18]|nr:plastocyanin [Herbaspirillum sp. HC18]
MKKTAKRNTLLTALVLTLSLLGLMPSAYAHGDTEREKMRVDMPIDDEEHTFGKQGVPQKVDRTLAIDMHDTMRFGPSTITVRQGETIRLVASNKGAALHEMVLGTMKELKEHGQMMQKHPGMEHDEPYMAHVRPGTQEEMIWQFTQPGEYYYGCLIPGHFEAGMVGKIIVTAQ